jgi:hypothetical protein
MADFIYEIGHDFVGSPRGTLTAIFSVITLVLCSIRSRKIIQELNTGFKEFLADLWSRVGTDFLCVSVF